MFDLGGSTGRLRACPFLGTWHALLCEEAIILERRVATFAGVEQANHLRRLYCGRSLFSARLASNIPCLAMGAGEVNGCQG